MARAELGPRLWWSLAPRGGLMNRDLLDAAPPAIRYCPRCGSSMPGGRCPIHDEPIKRPDAVVVPEAAPVAPRSRRSSRLVVGIVVGVTVLLGVSNIAFWTLLNDSRHDVRAQMRSDQQAMRTLSADIASSQKQAADISVRLRSLEAKAAAQPDPAAIAKEVRQSVFTIETSDGLGSGFVVRSSSSASQLVTNFHVVESTWNQGGRTVKVKQEDQTYDGRITSVDTVDDLAIVETSVQLPPLHLTTAPPAVGDPVLVVGSPLGLGGTVSSGIVSALRDQDGKRYVQFSAPVSPGNSGGPVVDRSGAVIGVSVLKAVATGAEGLSFAIPVDVVCSGLHVC